MPKHGYLRQQYVKSRKKWVVQQFYIDKYRALREVTKREPTIPVYTPPKPQTDK